jgi:hypothetical protein
MVAAWRLASAVARLRTDPATALAPLSHMLKNGFFLVHGFFICLTHFPEKNRINKFDKIDWVKFLKKIRIFIEVVAASPSKPKARSVGSRLSVQS